MNRLHRVGSICILGLGVLVACLPERVTVLSPDDEILDDFIDEYYRERFSFYPSQSSEAGFPGHDDELERYDEETIRERIAWLADFRLRLIAVRVEELSRFAHPEALWLRSEVESELWGQTREGCGSDTTPGDGKDCEQSQEAAAHDQLSEPSAVSSGSSGSMRV